MKLVAFDTSGPRISLAAYDGKKKLASYESAAAGRHSESLLPELEKLLKKARMSAKSVECVAVGLGPGSFTGLRIGVTAAKMLAYASGARLIGVSSLEAAARGSAVDGDVAVSSDARKGQVYGAVYRRRNGKWSVVKKPAIFDREVFARTASAAASAADGSRVPASGIAEAALERAAKGSFDDVRTLVPHYIHPKDCNVQKK